MSAVNRPNRKASDEDLIRLNSVGLSLATIAQQFGCHPTTVTQRLRALNVDPADTRRTFMEDVFRSLTLNEMDWVADQLGPTHSIKDFVRNLLSKEYHRQNQPRNTP